MDHHKVHFYAMYTSEFVIFWEEKDMILLLLVIQEMCGKKGITVNVEHYYFLM